MWVLLAPERLSDRRIGAFKAIWVPTVRCGGGGLCLPGVREKWAERGTKSFVPQLCQGFFVGIATVSMGGMTKVTVFAYRPIVLKKKNITC